MKAPAYSGAQKIRPQRPLVSPMSMNNVAPSHLWHTHWNHGYDSPGAPRDGILG